MGEHMNEEQLSVFETFLENNGWRASRNKKGSATLCDGYGHQKSARSVLSTWEAQCPLINGYFAMDAGMLSEALEQLAPEQDNADGNNEPTMAERRQKFREMYTELYDTEEDGASIKTVSKKFSTGLPISDSSVVNNIRGLMMDDNFPPPSKEDCMAMISVDNEAAIHVMRQD